MDLNSRRKAKEASRTLAMFKKEKLIKIKTNIFMGQPVAWRASSIRKKGSHKKKVKKYRPLSTIATAEVKRLLHTMGRTPKPPNNQKQSNLMKYAVNNLIIHNLD